MNCLYLFSNNLSFLHRHRPNYRIDELVIHFWAKKVHFHLPQHQGAQAFFCAKIQLMKHSNPPLPCMQSLKKRIKAPSLLPMFVYFSNKFNGACAYYVKTVSNFNGSHFGLPLIKIHRMTGLPPKIVWTMMYSHRPKNWQYIDKAPFSSKPAFNLKDEKKTAIATHKMVEETSPKQHLCCQFEGISSTMTKFCTLSRIREAPFSLKSFAEGSQSVRKSAFWSRRWRNHAARSKLSGVVFAITFSGAFQFPLTTTTAATLCCTSVSSRNTALPRWIFLSFGMLLVRKYQPLAQFS